jgi:PAS domain S-box-containing protein
MSSSDSPESALQTERDLLTQIFETSPVAITVLNTEGEIIRANARAEEVLGLSPSGIEERSYDDPGWKHTAVDGGPFPDEEQPFVRVMETEEPVYDVQHAIEWPDGQRRILSVSGAPLREDDGEITGALFVVEDITERVQQRKMLRRREEKVRALYDAMSSLLGVETAEAVADRMLSLINDTFGYSISAVRFVRDGALVPVSVTEETRRLVGRDRPNYDVEGPSIVAEAFRSGETSVFDDVTEASDPYDRGATRAAAYIPIGRRGVITVGSTRADAMDPFDVRLLEILAHNAESVLDQLQTERELREARDAAEEASRLKSAMLANMSHEVRTPLTSIIGFAEIISDEVDAGGTGSALGERIYRFARLIRDSSLRLKETLDSVLQLSELEAGTQPDDTTVVDPAEEVRAVADDVSERAQAAGIALTVEIGPVRPLRLPGSSLVRRVLQNLVDNAIKFTPEDGTVAIRATGTDSGAWLEVEDTGLGMSREFQKHMFQAFKQESEGLRRSHEGSGLGLAIVQKLVSIAGGTIEVESTPGLGTRFAVFLPREE